MKWVFLYIYKILEFNKVDDDAFDISIFNHMTFIKV